MSNARLGRRLPAKALRGYASASTSTLPYRPATIALAPAVPKPPSPTWYTGSPSIVGLQRDLDSLVHRTRHLLHSVRILTRYSSSPDFAGTGIRLRFMRWKALGLGATSEPGEPAGDAELRDLLKTMPWKTREEFETEVQGAAGSGKQLRPADYDQLTGQLSELRRFQLYVRYALDLGGIDEGTALRKVDGEIGALVRRFGRPVKEVGEREGAQLERDEYGRYTGMGKKKDATARAWIVEVVHPSTSTSTSASAPAVTVPAQAAVPPVGRVVVNGRPISEFFTDPHHRAVLLQPFVITRTIGLYNVHILVHGSGRSSQSHACAHALAVSLLKALGDRSDSGVSTLGGVGEAERRWGRKSLEKSKLAERDPRVVERKKTGRRGARARYTWVKR